MSQLVTGEAVALDLQTAGVPSRTLATILDLAIQGVLLFLLFMGVAAVAGGSSEASIAAYVIVVIVLVGIGYPVVLETMTRGRTLGKMALGLRVVRDDGGPIRARHALARGLVGFFVEKPGISMGSAAVISAVLNDRAKRLGDHMGGTRVVTERVANVLQAQVLMPPPLATWAASLDLSQLPDETVQRARAFLARWPSLTPEAQAEIGNRLAAEVAVLVAPPPPPGVPAWAFLSAVVAERRRRAEQATPQQYGGPVPPGYSPPPPGYSLPVPPAPTPQAPEAGPFAPPA